MHRIVPDFEGFLTALRFRTNFLVGPHLLDWIREDSKRAQSIFFSGPLIFDILYNQEHNISSKLIIEILAIEEAEMRRLLLALLDKIETIFSYTVTDALTINPIDNVSKESCHKIPVYIKNIGGNRLKLCIQGCALNIEVHLFKSNNIKRLLVMNNAGDIPYIGDGLVVSCNTIYMTWNWLNKCRSRILATRLDSTFFKNARKSGQSVKPIESEALRQGFLTTVELCLSKDTDPERYLPRGYQYITLDNVLDYTSNSSNLEPNSTRKESHNNTVSEVGTDKTPNFSPEVKIVDFLSWKGETPMNLGTLYSGCSPAVKSDTVYKLLSAITHTKKSSILESLPDPYQPPH
jgi:hypothetical protein